MEVSSIDHLVLTVDDINSTIEFYQSVLGMSVEHFGEDRIALKFGNQKINLHQKGKEFAPKADRPTPGSADICFLTEEDIKKVMISLKQKGVEIVEGPVDRTGAIGTIMSIYIRDPDANLIEISKYY